jgi:hypothetical protein
MHEGSTPKRALDIKLQGKFPRERGRPRQIWEEQVRKDVTQKEEHGRKLMRRRYKKETQT